MCERKTSNFLVLQSHSSPISAGQAAALRSSSVSIATHLLLAACRSTGLCTEGARRSTTCSTHAGLYSSSQLMAIVVKAGERSGR